MKRFSWTLLVVALVVVGVALSRFSSGAHSEATAGLDAEKSAQPVGEHEVAAHPAPAAASAVQAEPQPKGELTADEKRIMEMYDEILAAFESHADDCQAMAEGMSEAVAAGEAHVKRYQERARGVPPAQAEADARRFALVAAGQAEHIRLQLSKAMSTCSTQLLPVLQRLSAIGMEPKP